MSQNSGIVIRRMVKQDVPDLQQLHSAVFRGYDSTMMGADYLKGLYHTLACHRACTSIVALEDGSVLGWVGGVEDWPAFQRALIRRNARRAPAIFFSILKNKPRLLGKTLYVLSRVLHGLVGSLRRRNESKEKGVVSPAVSPSSSDASLLVIGVAPKHQKQSLGQLMIKDFHRRVLAKGFVTSNANTFSDNESGNRAFQKAGYQLVCSDDGVNHYIKYLTKETVDSPTGNAAHRFPSQTASHVSESNVGRD